MRRFGPVLVTLLFLPLAWACGGSRSALPAPSNDAVVAAPSNDAVVTAPSNDAGAELEALAAARKLVESQPTRALLVRGPYAFRGLPAFPPNAVPGLAGEYLLSAAAAGLPEGGASQAGSLTLRVWYTRESLVFGEGWKRGSLGPYLSYELRPDSSPRLYLAVIGEGHELFLELPRDSAGLRSFALALERKYAQFFAGSTSDAELSFPAYVDLPR